MKHLRALLVLSATCLAIAGCSGPKSHVVLLPDNGNPSGEVLVTNTHGSQVLNRSWQTTEVGEGAPSTPVVQDKTVIQEMVGPALKAMPPPPVRFILYCENNKATLTPESKKLVPGIFKAIAERAPAEMSVTGHTDTVGTAKCNYKLGLLRANTVTAQLTLMGAKPALVDISSHGEADLLIKTPDNTPEPRNRRIEVTIR